VQDRLRPVAVVCTQISIALQSFDSFRSRQFFQNRHLHVGAGPSGASPLLSGWVVIISSTVARFLGVSVRVAFLADRPGQIVCFSSVGVATLPHWRQKRIVSIHLILCRSPLPSSFRGEFRGKTTLLFTLACTAARGGGSVLFVCGRRMDGGLPQLPSGFVPTDAELARVHIKCVLASSCAVPILA
jgi:hypothetical protein